MNYRMQLIVLYVGFAFSSLIGFGQWYLMGFMPLLEPSMNAQDTADYFMQHRQEVLIGAICLQIGYAGILVLIACISQILKRIEAPSTFWTYMYLCVSAIGYMPCFFAYTFWSVAAYRVDRAPELIQLMNDVCALSYVSLVITAWLTFGAIGFCILGDKREKPLFPRWVGYLNIWATIGSMPSAFVSLFNTGPFSWNGVVGFWIPIAAFFIWTPVMFFYLRAVYLRLAREEDEAVAAGRPIPGSWIQAS